MKIKAFLIAIVAIFIFAIASIGQTPDPLNENFDFYTRGEYRTGEAAEHPQIRRRRS